MATKTLSITEEAYNELKGLKIAGESFSQVILRLVEKNKKGIGALLNYITELQKTDEQLLGELADSTELVYKQRKKAKWSSPTL
ncbi:MAG: antitoxin VapB family protein [Candidatus Heimdallarchaeota archaeon]|nr:antitoxin VapB family protein [Candidatus Heimdallarchaeota archaeon]